MAGQVTHVSASSHRDVNQQKYMAGKKNYSLPSKDFHCSMNDRNYKTVEIISSLLTHQLPKKNAKMAIVSPIQVSKPAVIIKNPSSKSQLEIDKSILLKQLLQKMEMKKRLANKQVDMPVKSTSKGGAVMSVKRPRTTECSCDAANIPKSKDQPSGNSRIKLKRPVLLKSVSVEHSYVSVSSNTSSSHRKLPVDNNKQQKYVHDDLKEQKIKRQKMKSHLNASFEEKHQKYQDLKGGNSMKVKHTFNFKNIKSTVKLVNPLELKSSAFPPESRTHISDIKGKMLSNSDAKYLKNKNSRKKECSSGVSGPTVTENGCKKKFSYMPSSQRTGTKGSLPHLQPPVTSTKDVKAVTLSPKQKNNYTGSSIKTLKRRKASVNQAKPNRESLCDEKISSTVTQTRQITTTNSLPIDTSADCPTDVEMSDVSCDFPPPLELLTDMQIDEPSHDPESCYVVVDTNILISDLKFVNELKDIPLEGSGLPHLFIPWIVIQELDRLKLRNNKTKGRMVDVRGVIDAIKYLNTMFSSKHPRFHGQTAKLAAKWRKSYDQCNDDLILGCCLALQEEINKEKVVLLTNDINLCNKAFISGVKVYTMESLLGKLKMDSSSQRSNGSFIQIKTDTDATKSENDSEGSWKREVDFIMCEIKMLLRCILKPYLKEAMIEAFGDLGQKFLPQATCSLSDILDCFEKYWISVFGCILPKSILNEFQKLCDEFSISRGYLCDVDHAMSVLNSVEIICKELLKVSKTCQSDLDASLCRIGALTEQCRMLQQTKIDKRVLQNLDDKSKDKEAVFAVFDYIWGVMNHLCGMIMDFVGEPHEFIYNKPNVMPSKEEFALLIPSLYPGIYKIKSSFSKVLQSTPKKSEAEIGFLYNHLVQFIPSLQIQIAQPPLERFSANNLKQYFYDPENKDILQNGFEQLEKFHSKLNESVHNSVWTELQVKRSTMGTSIV